MQRLLSLYASYNRDRISLAILDLVLPDMEGLEVYYRMRELEPTVRVLISSGYPIDNETEQLVANGALDFAMKPYKIELFLSQVRCLLEKGKT